MDIDDNRELGLWSLFWTFLKIGSTAFGGFMALISVVQNYVVERRKLLTNEEMLDGVSLATILPGPIAVNVVAYVGYQLRGGVGALVSATAVTLPTFLLVLFLSYSYFTWGDIPSVNKFFQGFIPAVAAIIVAAVWNMGRKAIKGAPEAVIAVLACALLIGVGGFFITLCIILAAGVAGFLLFREPSKDDGPVAPKPVSQGEKSDGGKRLYSSAALPALSVVAPFLSTDLVMAGKLLSTFAGMSLLLFGGGFVFIPLIQEIVVDGQGWVTHKEFIDGIALGQVTPGPILISAAFIGYKMAGLLGATAATIGIFTPPAVVMVLCARYLDKIKRSKVLSAAMRGIRSGVIGMILAASYVVASTAQMNWISLLIFTAAVVALIKLKLEVVWIIPGAGILGLLFY
ncbi:MAG: chromate efflux transporter [Candidatus Thiodiazotropha sp. (ex Dulcina madagascariensis)]|nr:chromate efflux transporter [Candidatus Thiodiazotropha sp. (ex Dulcina madagascariensis)]MCU7935667.1 chromate efflux transporter [Candidatus Thiodiazotropha sp. (ex Dulcina madagascariensis)]